MRHFFTIVGLFLLGLSSLSAQKTLDFQPPIDTNSPTWVRLMYAENPNVWKVDSSMKAWYQTHPYTKNSHTQYYKKWRRSIEPYINGQGYVAYPSPAEAQREQSQLLDKLTQARTVGSPWNCLGPFETYSTGTAQIPVSWQVNIYAIDQSESNPNLLYAGSESGGIFKTNDKGLNWELASESSMIRSVEAVEIHPTNTDVVYAGDRHNVYQTTDGGDTWTSLLYDWNMRVNDISVHPTHPDTILVSGTEGYWQTIDGGQNWTKIYADRCYDIEHQPNNPDVVYLLMNVPADTACGFFKSTDGGQSFTRQTAGWYASTDPNRRNDGARMTVTPADSNRVYVILIGNSKSGDNGFIGVYRSNDAGVSWTLPNPPAGGPYSSAHPNLMTLSNTNTLYQGYYDLSIAASHIDPDKLLIGGLNLWRSDDGATTFTALGGYQGSISWIHPDVQEIKVMGDDVWVTTDGGINYSNDSDFMMVHESRKYGIVGSDMWGFGTGWNEDVLVGGRYHNGNTGFHENYPAGQHLRLGGGEAPTGYVNPGENRKTYFSDIGGKIIPKNFQDDVISFSVSKYPNQSYWSSESSEMEFDPRYYNVIYLGNENKLWKTQDGGGSFEVIGEFGTNTSSEVKYIEISRSNPDVIYCSQQPASGTAGELWKTTDGGINWTSLALPAGNRRKILIALSATNENELWIAYPQGGNGEKVYYSTDGGGSWTNWTSSTLDGESVRSIVHQAGSNGALYVGTANSVFYRNLSMPDWDIFNNELPNAVAVNIMRPFYRDSKIRLASYGRGIWENELCENSAPIAQPMVNKQASFCTRDTLYFEDYSILNHAGASWQWNFPGGNPSTSTQRNPKVMFPTPGYYNVSLMITDSTGATSSKSIDSMIVVTAECEPDTIPGNALELNNSGDYGSIAPLNIRTNEITFSAWVKPNGDQPDYAGIIFSSTAASAGMNFRPDDDLAYHWPGGAWWWDSGLPVPADEWSHVAMVVEATGVTLYLNGVGNKHSFSADSVTFDANLLVGSYKGWGSRNMTGAVDEVCVWNRSLTQEEIRAQMHLTQHPENDSTLLAYYQFNRASGEITDRAGNRHMNLNGGATRSDSNAPVGEGTSSRLDVSSGGLYNFTNTGLSLEFPATGTYPNGELVISRINQSPDQLPNASISSRSYWVIHNYGSNDSISELSSIRFDRVGQVSVNDANAPSTFKLYKRQSNDEGNTWNTWLDEADNAIAGSDGSITFSTGNGINSFSQFVIMNENPVFPVELLNFDAALNPDKSVRIYWATASETQNAYFQVERSIDGQIFEQIQQIPAQNPQSNSPKYYETTDQHPAKGYNYYRLKQVDLNGNHSYSEIRSVLIDAMAYPVVLYPNPLKSGNPIHILTDIEGSYQFKLFDATHKLVKYVELEGNTELQIPELSPGLYFYEVIGKGQKVNGKLMLK